jgi:Tol biopolymer transport system component/DNA-binding winged helix-turn-helix (wHTH) protein
MTESNARQDQGPEPRSAPFRVGDWLAEPAWHRIRRGEETIKLEPRVMRLLETLAAAPGQPLSRPALMDRVWPDVTVNEEALSRAVSQLRRALGDDPREPRYLQTVHKGYCLIAAVADAAGEAAAPGAPATKGHSRNIPWPLLLLLLTGLAGALFYRALVPAPQRQPQTQPPRTLVPVTSEPGREIDPAVSPDGNRVAYLASGEAGYDLYVRAIGGGAPVRLTRSALTKGHLAWSPNGNRIAFVGANGKQAAIYLATLAGGAARKLIDLPSWSYGLDWSPDGRMLAYSDAAPGELAGIVLLDVATKAARPLPRSAGSAGDVKPVFSPNGEMVAFIRTDALERQQVVVAEVRHGGAARVLASPPQQLRGLDWTPGGDALIMSARSGRRFGLWRLPTDGSEPEALPVEGGDLLNPSVSAQGRIVVEEVMQDRDIWAADFSTGEAAPLIQSTHDDYDPAYAPATDRLAFVSERSGHPEIWIKPARGEAHQLTSLSGPRAGQISWSPDGSRLAFLVDREGAGRIHIVELRDRGPARPLHQEPAAIPIGWTSNGDALFILTSAGRHWRLGMLTISDGRSRPVTGLELRLAAVARDGRSIFAIPVGENKLLHIKPGLGVVRQFRLPPLPRLAALLSAEDAVYLLVDVLGTARVHRLDLDSGTVAAGVRLDDYLGGTFSIGSKGQSIVYTRTRETANDLAWTQL